MFKNCTSLKGGNGTIYNSEHTDKEYARIDVSDSKGYLTEYATVLLKDDADNAVTLTAYNGKTKNVQLMGRTLYRDGKWNTLCLPFAISALGGSPLEGATVMELDTNGTYALDGSPVENGPYKTGLAPNGTLYLYFKTANAIEAGKPYIVQWATTGEDIVNPVFTNVAISNTPAATIKASNSGYQNVEFVGAYSPTALDADDKSRLYLGSGNNLYYPSATMTIGACRAFFHVDISGSVNAVRAFNLAFSDPKTGIISTTNSTNFTNSDNSWYSLDGRKLGAKPTKKGLYIYRSAALENGKIVAIK